jgi:hypothetical protein
MVVHYIKTSNRKHLVARVGEKVAELLDDGVALAGLRRGEGGEGVVRGMLPNS